MNKDEDIFVTRPVLPPLDDFHEMLNEIWESRWLTNNGPFHCRFEREISEYLGIKNISLTTNGTLALIVALIGGYATITIPGNLTSPWLSGISKTVVFMLFYTGIILMLERDKIPMFINLLDQLRTKN